MAWLRNALVVLMMLALLPWGAHVDAAQAAARGAAVAAAGLDAGAADETRLSAAKHCRGAGLPGSPCGHDLPLPPAGADPPAPARAEPPHAAEPLRLTSRSPAGLLDPPRSC